MLVRKASTLYFAKRSNRAAVALPVSISRSARISVMNPSSRPEVERMLSMR
jgi:hypothetical protein